MYIEHVGPMRVSNLTTGEIAELDFKAEGWGGKNRHVLEGYIYENAEKAEKKEQKNGFYVYGKYTELINAYKTDGKGKHAKGGSSDSTTPDIELWKANPMPDNYDHLYFFTNFTLQLNHLPDELKRRLPISDSRLRPDLRALEEGDITLATAEKLRLEEK